MWVARMSCMLPLMESPSQGVMLLAAAPARNCLADCARSPAAKSPNKTNAATKANRRRLPIDVGGCDDMGVPPIIAAIIAVAQTSMFGAHAGHETWRSGGSAERRRFLLLG